MTSLVCRVSPSSAFRKNSKAWKRQTHISSETGQSQAYECDKWVRETAPTQTSSHLFIRGHGWRWENDGSNLALVPGQLSEGKAPEGKRWRENFQEGTKALDFRCSLFKNRLTSNPECVRTWRLWDWARWLSERRKMFHCRIQLNVIQW